MSQEVKHTPIFVSVDGKQLPDIKSAFGRAAYQTGQHTQCQPHVSPEDLKQKRVGFFTETICKKRDKEEVAKETMEG